MNDNNSEHDDTQHEGPIKTPKQLVLAVIFAFVVPIAVIVLLVSYVGVASRPAAGSDALNNEAVAARIQPVGRVEVKDAFDLSSLKTGEQVYAAQCSVCHASGVANAPKIGDTTTWGERIKAGYESLLNSALKGKGAMGTQGGGDFSDLEIGRAVVYMANQGGAKFEEPKLPPVVGSAAAAVESQ